MIPNPVQIKLSQFCNSFKPYNIACIGLGNIDRADDGAGIVLAQRLQSIYPERVFSESEKPAESHVFHLLEANRWKAVLFFDAARFEGKENVHFFSGETLTLFQPAYTTHRPPFSLLVELLEEKGVQSAVLGMRPVSTAFLEPITFEMNNLIAELEIFMKRHLSS